MRKVLFCLLISIGLFNFLNAQNITKGSQYSQNWASFINRKTIDMQGALYEGIPGGNLVLISGNSPFSLIKEYHFFGARSDTQVYYTHQVPLSYFYESAPALGVVLVEGYSLEGSKLTRYINYVDSYQSKLKKWEDNNIISSNNTKVAKPDAKWTEYPIPQPEDVNWADGSYAGELY
ncbi:hypothetical protein [Brachyspira pilosicoli]|uniref:hypothetical protein n=1 Tax=Brachyspira pilosicoli TaxID=52584 RepID=UPI002665532B|nr:hypothetical protein [Brachyspira pilosicoli]